jgi:subtilase family protein
VAAAGNDGGEFGRGSIGSPGSAASAITAGSVTGGHGTDTRDVVSGDSSVGPTPVSLRLKPDVAAPGVAVLSSVPRSEGLWDEFSGTSMASPHVAGAVALLRQRHPGWTVEQLRSALVTTGAPVYTSRAKTTEVSAAAEGGGRIDAVRADRPLLFAEPATLSFGIVRAAPVTRTVGLADAGGGAGTWASSLDVQGGATDLSLTAPPEASVPGTFAVTAANPRGVQRDVTGFVVLSRGGETRRLPFWFRAARPAQLALEPHRALSRPGVYGGSTLGKRSLVSSYRYPDLAGVPLKLGGPEQVFRVRVTRTVANFGVAVLSRARGVRVSPRIVFAGDENRVTGYAGLPLDLNPYRTLYGRPAPIVAVDRPARGDYDVVFDTPDGTRPGRFTFRFWIGDARPPTVRLRTRSARVGQPLRVSVTDAGSGVDRSSITVSVDGQPQGFAYRSGRVLVATGPLSRGRHTLRLTVSDHQEAKNMENVPPILPNTRTLRARFTLR